ncbi:MAG: helix-turn-helix transcriptional regulator [Marinicella sp.]|nr:helix-turn-helix transcriptional regulator [Xanthomonadales bacterium]
MNNREMNIDTDKLKKLRKMKGWTQQHLADVSGISLRTIQRAELNGSVSIETVNALCAIFNLKPLDWQPAQRESTLSRTQILKKGWVIALMVIFISQLVALALVWLFVGTVSALWLKSLLAIWLILGLISAIIWITFNRQEIQSFHQLSELNNFVRDKQRSNK